MLLNILLSTLYLFVSGNVGPDVEGVKIYQFDTKTADATYVSGLSGLAYPSFFCFSHNGKYVYTVSEQDEQSSAANALRLDQKNMQLSLMNSELTHAGAPCNIIVNPTGKYLYTSNYFGGNLCQFPIQKDGKLGSSTLIPFAGHSVVADRQDKPYLHAVNFTPDRKFLMADDLGTDNVHVIPLGKGTTPLKLDEQYDLFIKAGAGPRHLCWAPDEKHAYLVGELSGEVFTLQYENQKLSVVQCIQADEYGGGGSADIHCTHDGRFVYASHRLKGDGVSIMRVQPDGTLQKVGYQKTGLHPRNFTISPDDKWVLVACRDSNEIWIYKRDLVTGMLTEMGHRIRTQKPVCLQWYTK